MYHVLEEKKYAALRAIETSKNIRLEKLQTQVEEYQGLLENNGLVGYAQEVLKETDPSCFVQTAKQLHVRYLKYLLFEVQVYSRMSVQLYSWEMILVMLSCNSCIRVCIRKQHSGEECSCPATMPSPVQWDCSERVVCLGP